MAMTEGYWISPTGDVYEVIDHLLFIQENFKRFGYKKAEAEAITREDRDQYLRAAMGKGWIRVRGHGRYRTFELYSLNGDSVWQIKNFLEKDGAWENEMCEIHEISTGRGFRQPSGFFLNDEALAYTNPGSPWPGSKG